MLGPQKCSGTVAECWPDDLVLELFLEFPGGPLLPTKHWLVWFRLLISGWGTLRQLLPWRHLQTCVIQCLLALPDRTETRQRAVFLQPCDGRPCDQRVPLQCHPEGICPTRPMCGWTHADCAGQSEPACCERQAGDHVGLWWSIGHPKNLPKASPDILIVTCGETFRVLRPHCPQPEVGPGRLAHQEEEESSLRVVRVCCSLDFLSRKSKTNAG